MVDKKTKKRSFIMSTVATLLIVGMLIFSEPASAVSVAIGGLDGQTVTKGDYKVFHVNVTIQNKDSYIPISNADLDRNWTY